MSFYAGIDLGGTKIAAGIFDTESGRLIAHDVIPTHSHEGIDAVIRRMVGIVQTLTDTTQVRLERIGLGVPAVIDYERGMTLLMPNLAGDWFERPLVAEMQAALNLPVALINDARAFTLAEATQGAGRGGTVVACFTIGTGIGGGIAINGRLHLGLKNAAGEFGHQTVEPNGAVCGCGNRGCLETLASGYAITAQGVEAMKHEQNGHIALLAQHDPKRVTPGLIMQAAERGDLTARDILTRAAQYIGVGIANILTILSADKVVLGGGVSQLGPWLFDPIWATVRERCHTIPLDQVTITQAALGQHAGIIGASLWASQQGTY